MAGAIRCEMGKRFAGRLGKTGKTEARTGTQTAIATSEASCGIDDGWAESVGLVADGRRKVEPRAAIPERLASALVRQW